MKAKVSTISIVNLRLKIVFLLTLLVFYVKNLVSTSAHFQIAPQVWFPPSLDEWMPRT